MDLEEFNHKAKEIFENKVVPQIIKAKMKQTAVEWFYQRILAKDIQSVFEQAKAMEKEQMLDFGDFIIDELEPMAQNREWVEERYNYFKSE